MNELDGSDDDRPTSEGSDGPQYGGDDGGEEMGSHSQAAIHTMSAHNSDGYGVGSDNVSLMSHSVLLCILTCCSVCH